MAALALLAMAVLAGCSGGSSGGTPSPTASASGSGSAQASSSAPAGTQAPLARFYDQKLDWSACNGHFQCAQLLVPLDYTKPAGATIEIAVVKQASSGSHQGSLIVNPGGPGGSGVQFEVAAASQFSQLTDHFDLVSFDPRGVGQSDPVRCLSGPQLDTEINTNPVPTTAAGLANLVAQAKLFASSCYARNGSLLEHIGTVDTARDMDVLRAALGDSKLTYYGASYGTYLGAEYAALFPTRIRAMVLDGALNPAESATANNEVQAEGFQTDLDDFLAACVSHGSCPLGSNVAAAHASIEALRAKVTATPEPVGSRTLGPGNFFEGLASGMYSTTYWPQLTTAIVNAIHGNGAGMLAFSDNLTERSSNGTYTNLIESNTAINCIDRPYPTSLATYTSDAKRFAAKAPDFGAAVEYSSLPCAFWKVPAVQPPGEVHAPGAPPILVIGTTHDPATPFVWAQALASQLGSGVLLTHVGDGHTAYLDQDACVDAAVKAYVDDLAPPKAGTVCK
jgi:pimeloyl-ACP methyl ester carboxylesterase